MSPAIHYDIGHLPPEIRQKLTLYLFLNLTYLLKKYNEHIQYGHPQYSRAENGFTIIIYRVGFETYHYVIRCLESLGCRRIIRECGTTIAVLSDTHKENMAIKNRFISLLAEAEERLVLIGDKTPQEYYALKTNPVIIDVYNTDHQHFVVLEAEIDAFSRMIWGEIGWGRILENNEISCTAGRLEKILVRFYKKKPRDRFLRHLRGLGVVDGPKIKMPRMITNLKSNS